MHTITNPETGNTFKFVSQEAYKAAEAWYNDTSKEDLIAYYVEHDVEPIGAIWADADCTRLADDWADTVMEMWARNEFDPTGSRLDKLIADLDAEHPLPEIATSLAGTTYDTVSIRVDEDGGLIKISLLAGTAHAAPGIGIDLSRHQVEDYTDEDGTWDSLRGEIEAGLMDVLR